MKNVSVRIGGDQAMKLHVIADQIAGCSINGLVQEAVALWLEVEAPVYQAAAKAIADKRRVRSRQAVEPI